MNINFGLFLLVLSAAKLDNIFLISKRFLRANALFSESSKIGVLVVQDSRTYFPKPLFPLRATAIKNTYDSRRGYL